MYEKYNRYKDSGVEWLGMVPEHWEMRKGKWLFNKEERSVRKEDEIVTCFRDGEVTLRKNRRLEGFTNALQEHGYQGVRKGDLVIHAMDAFAGAIGVSDSDGKSTPVYSVCTPRLKNEVNQYFYAYFLRNMAQNDIILSLAKGIRQRSTDFRFKDFGELEIVFPPLSEQTSIATFLDKKTSQIYHTIELKEKTITLLKERKQIMIQELVTGKWKIENGEEIIDNGELKIDNARLIKRDEAEMKDSGVEWIGMVPKSWEIKNLRYAFEFLNNRRIPLSALERENRKGEYPYYGASGIIDYVDDYLFNEDLILIGEDGANLLSKSTPLAFVAKGKYWVNNHAHILRPKIHGLRYWAELLSLIDYTIYITGAAQPKLSRENLGSVKVVIPPLIEINNIINYIETESSKIDNAISLQEQEIEKLKELKATLIDSAVTGKIKIKIN